MSRTRSRMAKSKLKKLAYELIRRDSAAGRVFYPLLEDLVEAFHEELKDAKIALAWNVSWQPDTDGRVILGKCRKASDLDRELVDLDFVIILRKAFMEDPTVNDDQRKALLDHELTHAAVKYDADGEPVCDERGRTVYRVRKHDVEDFTSIVRRYGCYKSDLEAFAKALEKARQLATGVGWVGYRSLRERLREIGIALAIDVVGSWSEAERREVYAYVVMQLELKNVAPGGLWNPDHQSPEAMPPCLAAAVQALASTA